MLKTTETTKEWSGYPVKIRGAYDRDPIPHWNPPIAERISHDYSQPPIRREYSKMMSDPVWVKGKWKDCQHHSVKFGSFGHPPSTIGCAFPLKSGTDIGYYIGGIAPFEFVYSGLAYSTFGPLGHHITDLPDLLQDEADGDGFVPKPPALDSYITASLRAMMPTIKNELSLVNSIIELKDFRSLPHTLLSLKNFASRLTNVVKRKPKLKDGARQIRSSFSASTPTMSEALGVGSDAYLQSQFNILPLLSDIAGINTAIRRTKARVNDLLVRQGKRQVKHFKLLVPTNQATETSGEKLYQLHGGQFDGYLGSSTTETGSYASPSASFKCVREFLPDQYAEFHAQVEYNFWFTRFQTENAQWLGLLDALGVNLNPAIIWNAIPWTFVIDWVVDIGRWLNDRRVLNLEPAVNISRYMWSWKLSRTVRLRIAANTELVPQFSGYTYLPDLVETIYRRQNELPTHAQFLTGSGLSSKELSLGVALLITTGKHHKSRKR
jgi:hypothetical protein